MRRPRHRRVTPVRIPWGQALHGADVPWASSTSSSPTPRSPLSPLPTTRCRAARSRPRSRSAMPSSAPRSPDPWPDGAEVAVFGLGCFWGAEKAFWQTPGVISTAVGYAGGVHARTRPTRRSARAGPATPRWSCVVYDPARITYDELLRIFWEHHDPTQGMRQGNDQGTQYRSAIYWPDEDAARRRGSVTRRLPGGAHHGRLRRRSPPRSPTPAVLLRRGLPPAVPPQGRERINV